MKQCNHSGNAIYGLGVIGAMVYYFQHATTFMEGLLGFFKAVFWPAMVLHKILTMLKM